MAGQPHQNSVEIKGPGITGGLGMRVYLNIVTLALLWYYKIIIVTL